jgi:hypothetical protein
MARPSAIMAAIAAVMSSPSAAHQMVRTAAPKPRRTRFAPSMIRDFLPTAEMVNCAAGVSYLPG